jgi:BRCA1/BRCA2-containing complex subunit 3
MNPTLTRVVVTWDAVWSCLAHALSTEYQEIMGLLLGHIVNGTEAVVRRAIVLLRKDKQKDRVEVGYEDLVNAGLLTEKLALLDNFNESVIGWYHSHPHITVMPSHVDVKTQGNYQQLDSKFIGLIFSVFDKGKYDVCAFQSQGVGAKVDDCQWSRVEIPIVVIHDSSPNVSQPSSSRMLEGILALQLMLLSEESHTFHTESQNSSALESTRYISLYMNSLRSLIDKQLISTLYALQSKKKSLLYNKNKSSCYSKSLEHENSGSGHDKTSATRNNVNNNNHIFEVIESVVPQWSCNYYTLKHALSKDGFYVQSVFENELFMMRSEKCILKIVPCLANRISPWVLSYDTLALSLPIIRFRMSNLDNSVVCEVFIVENHPSIVQSAVTSNMQIYCYKGVRGYIGRVNIVFDSDTRQLSHQFSEYLTNALKLNVVHKYFIDSCNDT